MKITPTDNADLQTAELMFDTAEEIGIPRIPKLPPRTHKALSLSVFFFPLVISFSSQPGYRRKKAINADSGQKGTS